MFPTRREFLARGLSGIAAGGLALHSPSLFAQTRDLPPPGDRPPPPPDDVKVLNPRVSRVPVSLIIDDSTCLANLSPLCDSAVCGKRFQTFSTCRGLA